MKLLFGCLVSLLPALAVAAPPRDSGPTATIKTYNDRLDRLIRKKEGEPVDKEAVRKLAAELFDYRELARRALAQHWATLSPAKQDEFVKTFSEMIEKNYVKQLRANIDYEVVYKDEMVTPPDAIVSTVVKVRTKGKSTDVSIDYKLHKGDPKDGAKGGAKESAKDSANGNDRWRVYDLVTDEVSMVRNYRTQFHKIITSESYDALLAKMRKRIAESDPPDSGK